jgi:multimeric flavodoxin WrbA
MVELVSVRRPRLLALAGSPRRGGNTEILLDEALAAAGTAEADKILLGELAIQGCRACDACRYGRCPLDDDMQELYPKLDAADILLVASPVFFLGLTSQLKAVIDRCQLFWNRKQQARTPSDRPLRRGAFIAVGATRGERLFQGCRQTMRIWFDTLDVEYREELLIRGVDARGAIRDRHDALRGARDLGTTIMCGL